MSNEAAVMAVALAVETIEHHFCLNDTPKDYPDMPVSFNPYTLLDYIRSIREATVLLGDGVKKVEESEKIMLKRRAPNTYAPLHTNNVEEPKNGEPDSDIPTDVPKGPEVSGDLRDSGSRHGQ
jgi:hypothetical protein